MSSTTRMPELEVSGADITGLLLNAMGIMSQGFSRVTTLPLAQPSTGYATSA
jgi:hypothetical protein